MGQGLERGPGTQAEDEMCAQVFAERFRAVLPHRLVQLRRREHSVGADRCGRAGDETMTQTRGRIGAGALAVIYERKLGGPRAEVGCRLSRDPVALAASGIPRHIGQAGRERSLSTRMP